MIPGQLILASLQGR